VLITEYGKNKQNRNTIPKVSVHKFYIKTHLSESSLKVEKMQISYHSAHNRYV